MMQTKELLTSFWEQNNSLYLFNTMSQKNIFIHDDLIENWHFGLLLQQHAMAA